MPTIRGSFQSLNSTLHKNDPSELVFPSLSPIEVKKRPPSRPPTSNTWNFIFLNQKQIGLADLFFAKLRTQPGSPNQGSMQTLVPQDVPALKIIEDRIADMGISVQKIWNIASCILALEKKDKLTLIAHVRQVLDKEQLLCKEMEMLFYRYTSIARDLNTAAPSESDTKRPQEN